MTGKRLPPEGVAEALAALRGLVLELAERHDLLAQLGTLLVDRGDDRAHRHAEIDSTASDNCSEDSSVSGTASVPPAL